VSGVALVTAGAGSAPLVLAHGGGVPEAAAVGLPVLVLLAFAVLERRARRREREQAGGPEGERGDA
jgi:membrane protein implicated in regulation of membrane protease activity